MARAWYCCRWLRSRERRCSQKEGASTYQVSRNCVPSSLRETIKAITLSSERCSISAYSLARMASSNPGMSRRQRWSGNIDSIVWHQLRELCLTLILSLRASGWYRVLLAVWRISYLFIFINSSSLDSSTSASTKCLSGNVAEIRDNTMLPSERRRLSFAGVLIRRLIKSFVLIA